MLKVFHTLCDWLNIPIGKEKTVWAALRVVFLGILMDGKDRILALPTEKKDKAGYMLQHCLTKKKVTVKDIERLTGFLNFLNRAIYPGRAFTRRMYSKMTNKTKGLRPYHHVNLDMEFRADCAVWLVFLNDKANAFNHYRPFIDLSKVVVAKDIGFFTDSSANLELGFGGVFGDQWFCGQWEKTFMVRLL